MTQIFHGGLYLKKQEMTRLRINQRFVAVTLAAPLEQKVIRHKTQENDGYSALVLEVQHGPKKPLIAEIRVTEADLATYPVGTILDEHLLDGLEKVRLTALSQGKGFQGVMKRHNFSGGPKTHGSKFHRAGGSTGNRKPRRTHKGHPMAGRMGSDTITLRSIPIIGTYTVEGQNMIAFGGSFPGAYASVFKVVL